MTSNDTTVNDGVSQKAISKRATSNRIGRPSRKDYDATTILQNQIAIVREVYDACQEIKATAAELNLAELKVRKLLITGNIISYEQTDTITSLQKEGKTLQQIMEITGLSRASINGYLPYTKVPYIRNCGPRHRFCVYDRSAGEYRIVSNCTQAIARDILVEAMYRMEKAGLEIIGHVHDEAIIEVPRGKYTVEEICRLMAVNPDWCRDLPLNADGYRGDYYFKS